MNEELYLIPRRKKGILHFIFSRTGIVLLFVAVQIAIFYSLYNWFTDYFKWFSAFQLVFSVGMVFYLFNDIMDYSAKLTWLFLIMIFPFPSTIFLWSTKKNIGQGTKPGNDNGNKAVLKAE